jgi:NAD(P)-dependent dehydrogenase (short-subunit alcohol dehydrogenase family)
MISKNSFNLDGKTIIVTGANGLLGIEFTESVLEFGGEVVALDIASNNLEKKDS